MADRGRQVMATLDRQPQRDGNLLGRPFLGGTGAVSPGRLPGAAVYGDAETSDRGVALEGRRGTQQEQPSPEGSGSGSAAVRGGRVQGARALRVRRGGCPPLWSCGRGRRRTPSWTSASRRCGARTRRSSGATRRSRRTGARPRGRASP